MNRMSAPSDVDYYNAVCGLSKAEDELRLEREEEALREQRWAEFVAVARQYSRHAEWWALVREVGDVMRWSTGRDVVSVFAADEGWPNVLRAIARAMDEEEQYRKELVDRR